MEIVVVDDGSTDRTGAIAAPGTSASSTRHTGDPPPPRTPARPWRAVT